MIIDEYEKKIANIYQKKSQTLKNQSRFTDANNLKIFRYEVTQAYEVSKQHLMLQQTKAKEISENHDRSVVNG